MQAKVRESMALQLLIIVKTVRVTVSVKTGMRE